MLVGVCLLAMHGVTAERTQLQTCGDCTFWKDAADGRPTVMSRTGSCETSCTSFLSFYNQDIEVIANGTFAGMGSVTYLDLSNNQLAAVANGTFAGLDRLQTLSLSNNQLAALAPGSFTGLGSVTTLQLQNNQIAAVANGTFAGLERLQTLYLENNPGTPFACPTVFGYSAGCEMNRINTCGGCTFWLDGRSWVLSKTGSCETSCTSLWLVDHQIMAVANGTFDDVGSLQQGLYLFSSGLSSEGFVEFSSGLGCSSRRACHC